MGIVDECRRHGETRLLKQAFRDVFVHGHSRAQDGASHEWHTGQLQQALDRTIFTIGAVQDRKHNIDRGESRPAVQTVKSPALPHAQGDGLTGIVRGNPCPGIGEAL